MSRLSEQRPCPVCKETGSVLIGDEGIPCPNCSQDLYKGTAWTGDFDGREWFISHPRRGQYRGIVGSRIARKFS